MNGVEIRTDPDNANGRLLLIDGIDASYVDLDDPTYLDFSYVRRIGDLVDVGWPAGDPLTVIHIGSAAGTLARYVRATRPRSRQILFEIDDRVITLARAHLQLRSSAGLKLRREDARLGLARIDDASQDLVIGDAFEGTRVPVTLGSVEATHLIDRVLRPTGIYVLNIIDSPPLDYAKAQVSTLSAVFPQIAAVAEPGILRGRRTGNVVFLASRSELPVEQLVARAQQAAMPERVLGRKDCLRFAGGARVLHDSSPPARVGKLPDFR